MKTFCQRDPRWASKLLGKSKYTIGRYGCTTCCVAEGAVYFGNSDIRPDDVAQLCKYTKEGLILWSSLDKVKLQLIKRGYLREDDFIKEALKNPTKVCMLQVQGNHWVFVTGVSVLGGYKIIDPWYGDNSTTRRYKNQVTGYAILGEKL
jgi:ABC-type bacteriocin/lantibiotic exporter with double-glycine peptidase domain